MRDLEISCQMFMWPINSPTLWMRFGIIWKKPQTAGDWDKLLFFFTLRFVVCLFWILVCKIII